MPVDAVSLSLLKRSRTNAPGYIFRLGYHLKVVGVDALRYSTDMVEYHALRDLAMG